MLQPMKGLVYLLINPAMPGIVKIGLTTQQNVKALSFLLKN